VKALVPFPEVLRMMNVNLEWTEQLGDAFLEQQADVMDSVQRLRARASEAGALRSTPQESVAQQSGAITIEPANPAVVYVPYYDPTIVYGGWPWPDDMPYEFPPPPDVVYEPGLLIGFGPALVVVGPLWGWCRWNWAGRALVVPRSSPARPGQWARWGHDPAHRRGVPYRDAATATRFLGAQAANRGAYRGFPQPVEPRAGPAPTERGGEPRVITPRAGEPGHEPRPGEPRPVPRPVPPPPPAAPARMPPAFESFGSGEQVRGEAARGSASRGISAPQGGGGMHGGGMHGGGSHGGSAPSGGTHR
ncbi:MAG TPA: DUF3300 domain-containing protein, partial [Steroidobacteraceae bacterium]|nr:DUF3300 domain-containing protein [Steroidobacteraceae bacterium]